MAEQRGNSLASAFDEREFTRAEAHIEAKVDLIAAGRGFAQISQRFYMEGRKGTSKRRQPHAREPYL